MKSHKSHRKQNKFRNQTIKKKIGGDDGDEHVYVLLKNDGGYQAPNYIEFAVYKLLGSVKEVFKGNLEDLVNIDKEDGEIIKIDEKERQELDIFTVLREDPRVTKFKNKTRKNIKLGEQFDPAYILVQLVKLKDGQDFNSTRVYVLTEDGFDKIFKIIESYLLPDFKDDFIELLPLLNLSVSTPSPTQPIQQQASPPRLSEKEDVTPSSTGKTLSKSITEKPPSVKQTPKNKKVSVLENHTKKQSEKPPHLETNIGTGEKFIQVKPPSEKYKEGKFIKQPLIYQPNQSNQTNQSKIPRGKPTKILTKQGWVEKPAPEPVPVLTPAPVPVPVLTPAPKLEPEPESTEEYN